MTKSQRTPEKATPIKAEFGFGADTFRSGMEKAAQLYEGAGEFNKDTLEACIESATVAGGGLQSIAQESSSYAKRFIEEAVETSKSIMGSKSPSDVIALQMNFAKNAFAGYVKQVSRLNETFVATAKNSSAPLQARAEAATGYLQKLRA